MAGMLRAAFRRALDKHPVITNTVVYASFYTAAELSQQTFNKYYTPEKPDYNLAAAARITCVGSTVYPPVLYFWCVSDKDWYRFLDKKFVGRTAKVVLTKVAADQLIMSPILLATFFTVMGIVERREDIFAELKQKYWQAFIANQAFWAPAQAINFFFMPSHLRVVYVASASFLWINVLCYIKRQKLHSEVSEEKVK